jgi:hypothetical protein
MKNTRTHSIIFFFVLMVAACFANRGMIPVNPNARIFEPNQRAMIAWNGVEEILLLSTDVSASESTMVLEVLPLPSEPKVKKGALETFQKAVALINRKIRKPKALSREDAEIMTPGGEVTFHKKIGAHEISVTHLLDAEGFIDWVKDYLKSLGIEKDVISDEMKKLINEYIEDDFVWFVFDIISLGKETVTNEPIQYHFQTERLFYPLKITSTGEGNTSIELLILTPRLLRNFPGLSIKSVRLRHDPITITNDELKMLDKDMYTLLGSLERLKLRIWEIQGDLKLFKKDLIAY